MPENVTQSQVFARSASTIISTNSWNVTVGSQPSFSRALVGSFAGFLLVTIYIWAAPVPSDLRTFILGLWVAQFTVALALAIRVLKAAFEQVDPRYEQVARFLGCTAHEGDRRAIGRDGQ